MGDPPAPAPTRPASPTEKLVANPSHGEKGDFVKVTVTLSPEVYELLATEVMRRKMGKERDAQLSTVIREAVVSMLEKRA